MFFTQQNLGQSYGNAPGIMRYLSFAIALNDDGAGAVNTTPDYNLGSGTPTYTRNTAAYALLSNGNYGSVASGTARGSYNASGVWLGYQVEGARADVLGVTAAIRRTMTDVGWVSGGGGITVGAATGADGVASAGASLTATGANGTILFTTVLGAAVRTYSAWVRRKTGTGTVNITGDNGVTWTAMTLTTAYKLFQFTTASAANPVVGFRIVTDTDAIEVDFNTLEAATFANPTPIPVNVSKAADVLTYVSSGNISATVGSLYFEQGQNWTGVVNDNGPMFVFNGAGGGGRMNYKSSSGLKAQVYDLTNLTLSSAFTASSSPSKFAFAWGGTSIIAAVAGSATSGTFDGNMNAGAAFGIGVDPNQGDSVAAFGTIRNIKLFSQALSDLQLTLLIT